MCLSFLHLRTRQFTKTDQNQHLLTNHPLHLRRTKPLPIPASTHLHFLYVCQLSQAQLHGPVVLASNSASAPLDCIPHTHYNGNDWNLVPARLTAVCCRHCVYPSNPSGPVISFEMIIFCIAEYHTSNNTPHFHLLHIEYSDFTCRSFNHSAVFAETYHTVRQCSSYSSSCMGRYCHNIFTRTLFAAATPVMSCQMFTPHTSEYPP